MFSNIFSFNIEGVSPGEDRYQHARVWPGLQEMSCWNCNAPSKTVFFAGNVQSLQFTVQRFPEAVHPVHPHMTWGFIPQTGKALDL